MNFACLIVLAVAVTVASGQNQGAMMKMAEECMKSEKLTSDEIAKVMDQQPPVSQGEKCFTGCMFEKMGIFENGMLNKERSQQICKDMFSGPMLEQALKAHAICDKEMDGVKVERCEGAAKMMSCFHKSMTDLPLGPPPKMMKQ